MAATKSSSWQMLCSTLRERIEYAFNNSHFCDIEFTVKDSNGDKVSLSASKFILSVNSPVFEAMFHGKLAEKGTQIDLPDCTKDGLQEMLRFVHSDKINLTGANIMEVLYLAKKYMLPFLEKRCYDFLATELTPGEVFSVLPQTQEQESKNTKAEELCWNVVDFQTHQAVTSQAFLNISHDLLKQVVERETLHTNEVNLFKAVDKWAASRIEGESMKENGEEKRRILGDEIVHLIRFPVMTQQEFVNDALVRNILQKDEVTEVMQIFSSTEPALPSFNRSKRKGQWDEIWSENRFNTIDSRYSYSSDSTNHKIGLEVSKSVFLAGVRLFAFSRGEETFTLSIKNLQSEYKLFSEEHMGLPEKINDAYYGHTVMINPPVLLLPSNTYSISIVNVDRGSSSGNWCCFGSVGKEEIFCEDVTLRFANVVPNSKNPGSTIEYGQFPSFLISQKVYLEKRMKTS